MADIRILEPIITWPKNLIVGAVNGLMHGLTDGAPMGAKLGAILGVAAGVLGAATPIPYVSAIIGTGVWGAVNGFVLGTVGGIGAGIVGGAALGTVGGAVHGVLNNGADHHHVENRRFAYKEQRVAREEGLDDATYHFLDNLYDNDPDFVAGLEEEREQMLEQEHGR